MQPLTVGVQCKEMHVTGNSAVGLLNMHESVPEKKSLGEKVQSQKIVISVASVLYILLQLQEKKGERER